MGNVHLTFDNGPHAEGTPLVLDVLSSRDISATFFVLGKHLATSSGFQLAERIRDAGHRLGNHSFSHEIPLGEDPSTGAVERELEATQVLLDRIWQGPSWFRPFGGGGQLGPHLLSPSAVRWLRDRKATCVLWNSVPGDWLDSERWVDRALSDVERSPATVMVLHDIAPLAMTHLGAFLDELIARGHTFSDHLPTRCTPIVEGTPLPDLPAYVSSTVDSTEAARRS